ncbi:MAG TPA: Hpt domain-containing protein [Xanthobacteraceae bacterium]
MKRRMPLPQDCETGPPEEATAAGERAFSACDSEPAIDLAHLDRMTFGEKSLAREVLRLFDRQADILSARISQADPEAAAALAHTLKGSARGVGAWKVAGAAEELEIAARQLDANKLSRNLEKIQSAVTQARAAIAAMLGAAERR